MLMLRNVRLIDPASKTDGIRDIIITDRKFLKIGIGLVLDASMLARAKGERLEIIDCRGLVAAPGLIDVHVHMRDPGFTHKESILTAAAAAAAGGLTCTASTSRPSGSTTCKSRSPPRAPARWLIHGPSRLRRAAPDS